MDRFILSALTARQGNGCKFFQECCSETWYWFYAVCILCLKWPFLNACFQQRNYVCYFHYWACICPWKAVHSKLILFCLLKLWLVFILDSWTVQSAGDSIFTRWDNCTKFLLIEVIFGTKETVSVAVFKALYWLCLAYWEKSKIWRLAWKSSVPIITPQITVNWPCSFRIGLPLS